MAYTAKIVFPSSAITYTKTSGVSQSGNIFTKTSATATWDKQVYSNSSFSGPCRVRFKWNGTVSRFMVGLNTDKATDANYTSIDFAIYITDSLNVQVHENGSNQGTFLSGTTTSDIFEVYYTGSAVEYRKNDVVFRTVAASNNLTLAVDSSIYNQNASFEILSFEQYYDVSNKIKEDYSVTNALGNKEYKFQKNILNLDVLYDVSILNLLLNAKTSDLVYFNLKRDGSDLFTGYVMPLDSASYSNKRSYISLQIVDPSILLEKSLGSSIRISNCWLSNPSNVSKSILHSLFSLARLPISGTFPNTAGTFGDVPTYDNISNCWMPLYALDKGANLLDGIRAACFENGWLFTFDASGNVVFTPWTQTSASTYTFSDSSENVIDGSYQIAKENIIEDSVKLKYNVRQSTLNIGGDNVNKSFMAIGSDDFAIQLPNGFNNSAPVYTSTKKISTKLVTSDAGGNPVLVRSGFKIRFTWGVGVDPPPVLVEGYFRNGSGQLIDVWVDMPEGYRAFTSEYDVATNTYTNLDTVSSGYTRPTITSFSEVGDICSFNISVGSASVPNTTGNSYLGAVNVTFEGDIKSLERFEYNDGPSKTYKEYTLSSISTQPNAQNLALWIKNSLIDNPYTYKLQSYVNRPVGETITITIGSLSSTGLIYKKTYSYLSKKFSYEIKGIRNRVIVATPPALTPSDSEWSNLQQFMETVLNPTTGEIGMAIKSTSLPSSPSQSFLDPGYYVFKDKSGYFDGATWTYVVNHDSGDVFLSGTISAGKAIRSGNYVAGSAGFSLESSGLFEAGNAVIRGDITSGTGSDIVRISPTDATYRLWIGHATAASAPTSVTKAGLLKTTSANIASFTVATNTISATNLVLTSGASNIANLTVGTGSTAGGLNSAASGSDVVFWGGSTFASRATAPYRVLADGSAYASNLTVAAGATIGTWVVTASSLESGAAGSARFKLNKTDNRVEVLDSSNAVKTAMGYLGGLLVVGSPWQSGKTYSATGGEYVSYSGVTYKSKAVASNTGRTPPNSTYWLVSTDTYAGSTYGNYASLGNTISYSGDMTFSNGSMLLQNDASFVVNASSVPVLRMGTYNGTIGFYASEQNTGSNFRARLTASDFFVGNDTNYLSFASGALSLLLTSFKVSSTLTSTLGSIEVSQTGTIAALTNQMTLTADATSGRLNHGTKLELTTGGTSRLALDSNGGELTGMLAVSKNTVSNFLTNAGITAHTTPVDLGASHATLYTYILIHKWLPTSTANLSGGQANLTFYAVRGSSSAYVQMFGEIKVQTASYYNNTSNQVYITREGPLNPGVGLYQVDYLGETYVALRFAPIGSGSSTYRISYTGWYKDTGSSTFARVLDDDGTAPTTLSNVVALNSSYDYSFSDSQFTSNHLIRTTSSLTADLGVRIGTTGTDGSILLNRTSDGAATIEIRSVAGDELRSNTSQSSGFQTWWNNSIERMRLAPTSGNLLIGTTTDSGYKLDVTGTGRLSGILTLSNSTNSTSSTTGALVVSGGLGVALDISTAGQVKALSASGSYGVLVPTGFMGIWPTSTIPVGWLDCNGQAVSRTTYSRLFAVIGTTFGAGNGSTTFNVPDNRSASVRGVGTPTRFTANTAVTLNQTINDQMETHTHGYQDSYADVATVYGGSFPGSGLAINSDSSRTTGNNSGRSGTETTGKAVGLYYIIKD